MGSGEIVDIDRRAHQEMTFGDLTPREAAEQFVDELENAIGSGTRPDRSTGAAMTVHPPQQGTNPKDPP